MFYYHIWQAFEVLRWYNNLEGKWRMFKSRWKNWEELFVKIGEYYALALEVMEEIILTADGAEELN